MKEIALYIDIEGFSKKFEQGGKDSFINLTNDLFKLGQVEFSYLSIVQFGGDGFLIKEILNYSNDLSKFIDISVALLKSIALRGGIGRVQISHGNLADISGLYSEKLQQRNQLQLRNVLSSDRNVMLINPVIGTSIINCHKLKGPKGPLLLIDKDLITDFTKHELIHYNSNEHDVYGINWLFYKSDFVKKILRILDISDKDLTKKIQQYIETEDLKDEWKTEAKNYFKRINTPNTRLAK